jgi:antitoxin VapB
MADRDPAIKKLGDKPEFMRLLGSAPWLKPVEKDRHLTKVFKSGNSLAVRIPAGTALKPGMEMELTVEDGLFLSYDPVEAPKRKFNIEKVAGCAKSLTYVEPESRDFEPRPTAADAPTPSS